MATQPPADNSTAPNPADATDAATQLTDTLGELGDDDQTTDEFSDHLTDCDTDEIATVLAALKDAENAIDDAQDVVEDEMDARLDEGDTFEDEDTGIQVTRATGGRTYVSGEDADALDAVRAVGGDVDEVVSVKGSALRDYADVHPDLDADELTYDAEWSYYRIT